jgi:hypothetical protein
MRIFKKIARSNREDYGQADRVIDITECADEGGQSDKVRRSECRVSGDEGIEIKEKR